MKPINRISLTIIFLFIALAFTIQIGYSATQKTFTLNWTNPVFMYEENVFNGSSATKDLLFNTSQNITVEITIPKNSTILFSNISLKGESFPLQSYASEQVNSLTIGNVNTSTLDNEIAVAVYGGINLLNSAGSNLWSFSRASYNFNDVSIGNISTDEGNEVVGGCQDKKVYVINASGQQVWNYTVGYEIKSVDVGNVNTSTSDNEIAVGVGNNSLLLLNSNGNQLWSYGLSGSVNGVAIGNISTDEGNEVVGGCSDGKVYVINASGQQVWNVSLGVSPVNRLAIGNVTSTSDNEIIVAADTYVFFLNSTGGQIWNYSIGIPVNTVAIGDVTTDSAGNEVVAGANDNKVYVFNSTGNLIWTHTTSNSVQGVDVGNITADEGNEVVAGTRAQSGINLYILNFQYYPANVSLDIENDGDYDWSNSGKLRTSINISNSTITPTIQNYLNNNCNSQNCNISLIFHSDSGGDLNITSINITYDYNASGAINSSQLNGVWARTNNTLVNESIGNQSINVSYNTNPANNIQIRYVKINSTSTECSFGGIFYSNTTVNDQNVCNLISYRYVNSSGSLPSPDIFWDNSMSTGIPIYANETPGYYVGSGTWAKNITIWNETTTTFYNVTANTSINAGVFIYDSGLYVDWYSNGTFYDITPTDLKTDCNTIPSYTIKTINGTDYFFVCKQDTDGDNQADFFKWKQPHTSTIVYIVNGTTNLPANLTNENVTPSSDKWNRTFNFSIFVNDSINNDNVTVRFWLKVDGLNWEMKESKNISGSGTVWFNYTANKSWVGTNTTHYMFEYKDFNSTTGEFYHSWRNTSNFTGLTVLKHNVSITSTSGDNTNVSRIGTNTTFLLFLVNDTDDNQTVSGVNCSFWITADETNFILSNRTSTNETGHCNFTFDPNSSYSAARQWWTGATYQDDYYYDTNSTNYTVNVFGELRINFTQSSINRNIIRGNNIILAKLLDENNNVVPVKDYTCNWYINNTMSSSNTNSSGYCNYTWNTTDCSNLVGIYQINVTLSGSASQYYNITINESHTNNTLKGSLNITIIRPLSSQIIHERDNVTLNSTVYDSSCGVPSQNYTVSWYFSQSGGCPVSNPVVSTNNTGNGTWELVNGCGPRVQTIIANATGELYNYNQTSVQTYIYGWSTVSMKDPYVSNQEINRSSLTVGESYKVICHVGDPNPSYQDVSNYPVNFWYINSTAEYPMGTNITQSNGNATYNWNVSNAAIVEGPYTVKCNITDNTTPIYNLFYNVSGSNDTKNVYIIGSSDNQRPEFLSVTATSAEHIVQNVTINANVSDTYSVTSVWVNITFPNGTNFIQNLTNTSSNNKIGIWNISLNTSLNLNGTGDYTFILYANDTNPNNTATTTGWFEVYLPLTLFGNITNYNGNTNVSADLTFYRNGTRDIIHQASTNSSYKYYNLTVHKRLYDLEVKVFNHTILFYDFNTTKTAEQQFNTTSITNITNPLNFTEIDIGGISPAKYTNKLLALDINSILVNRITTVTLNFSSLYNSVIIGQQVDANDVLISKCSGWSYTGSGTGNCSSWGEPTGTVNIASRTISLNTSSLSVYAASVTAVCGNGRCQQFEQCSGTHYCQADCGSCDTGGNTGGGSSGGGGSSVTTAQCGNNICETGENRDNCPQDCGAPEDLFSLRTNLTEVQMDLGEENTYALWVTNNLNSNLNVSISIIGTINKFVSMGRSTLTVGPRKEEITNIYVKIPNDAEPGTYTGQLSIIGNNKTQTIPVTIVVSLKGEVYLDVVVKALDKKVGINETAKFYITLYDMGLNKRFNANLGYLIKEYETDKIIYEENETKFIQSTQSFQKNIDLSNVNITVGRYWFEVRVKYGINSASQQDDFEVIKSFWTTKRISMTVIIVLTTTSVISILYTRKRYIQWKLGKARYIFPLDFNKLPRGKVWLGKIAETSKKAFFDMTDLRTHVLTAGATGSGKSVSATIFVEELLKEKIPVIVFDPTAQWTGFVRPCRDPNLLKYYKEFGLNVNDTRPYNGMIYEITDPNVNINFKKYMNPGEVTVFTLNKLKPGQYDIAVRNIIDTIFAQGWEESTKLKMVVVFDEVHRLLERYGGTGGYISLERACREFRKWGIGLIMVSQVLSDFKEAIKGNVLTEVQLHTKSLGDLSRIEKKYGLDYVKRVTKLEVGTGMIQNPKYNDGRPWFVAFRPTFHEPHKIPDVELETYKEYASLIDIIEMNIEAIEKSGKDVFDLKTELKLAKDKLKKGRFRMAKIYIDSLRKHLNIGEANT